MVSRHATIVDFSQLRDVVLWGFAAGVGLPAAFSFALLGTIRARERHAQGRLVSAALYGALALACGLVLATGLVLGYLAITEK